MPISKWDERFMSVAKTASEWSKDPNAKIGAVIVDERGQVAGLGFNGLPKLVDDSAGRLNDQKLKLELVVHAEVNAIIGAGARAQGGTIYVWGKPVCPRCAGSIIQSGIKRVVSRRPQAGTTSKWDALGVNSLEMFQEAGITVHSFDPAMISASPPTPESD